MYELHVPEIDPQAFVGKIEKDFIEKQPDSWMIQFYSFLRGQKALWHDAPKNKILLSKPIIRLIDNTHIEPFDADRQPNAILPSNTPIPDGIKTFKSVKDALVQDKDALEFLKELGLKELNMEIVITKVLLPRYSDSTSKVIESLNLRDIKWISKTLAQVSAQENASLLDKIKLSPILMAKNAATSERAYKKPVETFLPAYYTQHVDLEEFFEGNRNAWFLDEMYNAESEITLETLVSMGCLREIPVKARRADENGYVVICNQHSNHQRGLDGFDPDAIIEGLQETLKNINKNKARILWALLTTHYKLIMGNVESSTTAGFTLPKRIEKYSEMGELLVEAAWIPGNDGIFKKPSQIEMNEISEDIVSGFQESPLVASRLGIKDDTYHNMMREFPLLKELENIPANLKKRAEDELRKVIKKFTSPPNKFSTSGQPKQDIDTLLRSTIEDSTTPIPGDQPDGKWRSNTVDEEAKTRDTYRDVTQDKVDNSELKVTQRTVKVYQSGDFDPKTFLKREYDGHCQICNTRLDLGDEKAPYFDTYRIIKESELTSASEAEFNVICLCPNCHALAEHGGIELSEILNSVNEISSGNKIAEPIDERNGDFYVFKLKLAGRAEEIFYTPSHIMQIISVLIKKDSKQSDNL
jgi:hypothetical protein